jgi:hypothetical protein
MFQIGDHNHVIGREKSCYTLACDICESVGTRRRRAGGQQVGRPREFGQTLCVWPEGTHTPQRERDDKPH